MEITTEIITQKFKEYDRLYFNRELPMPRIQLLKSFRTLGYFSCNKIIGRRRLKGQRLEISCYYDWQEDALRDVIVHEMIHYYLAYKHIDNNISHGEEFQKMAQEMNDKYGLNVTVKVDTTNFKRTPSAPKLGYYLSWFF